MALLKGTLDILVLKALSWGPMHAFEITSWLEARSGGRLAVVDAALIQSVHRMEERGLVVAEWGVTENDRRARYYSVTRAGRAYLKSEGSALSDHVDAIATVLAVKSPVGK
jgi:PadR family transcriptional regulator, regulatory protein PadR